ncbi:MAG: transposase [Alphaproteobacteria bacterium]|nr:transposase [Alphaproteobacteria bacterium]
MVKGMQAQGLEWGEGYWPLGRAALASILEGEMARAIDDHLDRMAALDEADRRNGYYSRHLLTRRHRACGAAHPLRAERGGAGLCPANRQIDRMILSCFVLGLSTRKVGEALLPILGRPVSPATVSAVAKQLDAVVAAFHARPQGSLPRADACLPSRKRGIVLVRKTGAGALRRPVLVALGLRPDGKKEVIDRPHRRRPAVLARPRNRHRTVRPGTVRRGTVRRGTVRRGTVR